MSVYQEKEFRHVDSMKMKFSLLVQCKMEVKYVGIDKQVKYVVMQYKGSQVCRFAMKRNSSKSVFKTN